MPIMFNMLLREAGLPLREVRLLRHKDRRAAKGSTPYDLWRDDRQRIEKRFERYQSTQSVGNAAKLRAAYWASFVGTPTEETMFVGLYAVRSMKLMDQDTPKVPWDTLGETVSYHIYELELEDRLRDLIGKLFIDWGPGDRAWIQRADQQEKRVTELRSEFKEPEFPGFLNFMEPLSKLDSLPRNWIEILRATKGVYLLTCPQTKEQYVGSATSEEGGFWQRWQDYVQTGHGGNVALRSREPSDYQVSILEVAGSAATADDIRSMEGRWQAKLQSREMGLNRNWAGK